MDDLAIITVTYQSGAKIATCLDAALKVAPSAEIVVVDNASTDATQQLVRAVRGNIRLICLSENIGFGRACNLGAESTDKRWLLFVNPDVLLKRVATPRDGNDGPFGLGAGLIIKGDDGPAAPGVRAEATHAEDWIQEVWKLFLPRMLSRHLNARCRPADWPIGGMFMARRDEYQRIGGFDPRYFLYFEDRDLGMRYRKQNLPLHVIDGLAGSHWTGSSSTGVSSWRREAWSIISWLEYIATWSSPEQAEVTARRVVTALRGVARLADCSVLSARVRHKSNSADLIVKFLAAFDNYLPADQSTYYTGARRAIASARSQIS